MMKGITECYDNTTSSKKMKMDSTFRSTIKGQPSDGQSGVALGTMTLEERQEKVMRITSNLPEVYNKYFFTTMGSTEDNTKSRKVLAKEGNRFTSPVSPRQLLLMN